MSNILNDIRKCRNCVLCKNQPPLVQQSVAADIFWVGLSAVKIADNTEIPLSPRTNSGKLINSIELLSPTKSFYKTNAVKCLPLKKDKIRYPSVSEMKGCYTHLTTEIQHFSPKLIFLLGKQVASFVLKESGVSDVSLDANFNYSPITIDNYTYIPIHHPSFVLVYKRKKLSNYIDSLDSMIKSIDATVVAPQQQSVSQSEQRAYSNLVCA